MSNYTGSTRINVTGGNIDATLPADQAYIQSVTSSDNSSSTPINDGNNFTGTWEDIENYTSVVIAISTDQDGFYEIQFSSDGTNVDETLTRYYTAGNQNPPHIFAATRAYFRVIYYNNSGTNQTSFRLQSLLKNESTQANVPIDSTVAQDFDAVSVRPTSFTEEVALGRRDGVETWNKFGYNDVFGTTTEVIAEFGGAFNQLLSDAEFMDIVSTSANDTAAGTGVQQLVIFGVGGVNASDRNPIVDVIAMNGTTPVSTNLRFWGINRMTIFQSGTSNSNEGVISATAATSLNTMASMPAGEGTTQQLIYYVPEGHQFLLNWLFLSVYRPNGSPDITLTGKVYSEVVNSEFEIYRDTLNTGKNDTNRQFNPGEPLVIGETSVVWFEAIADNNNNAIRGRFSGKLFRDPDA